MGWKENKRKRNIHVRSAVELDMTVAFRETIPSAFNAKRMMAREKKWKTGG